jgi:glycerate kinase
MVWAVLRVVIAPDSFKGSASAIAAASAIAEGWRAERPDDELIELPQADGGEGTLDAVSAAAPGAVRHTLDATGPDGRAVRAEWLLLPDGTAVTEFAQSSGLPLMRALDPLGATSRGLGETIAAALAAGARSLVIGLGGSATTDGAAGALQALGMSLRDAEGAELERGGAALAGLASVDRSALLAPPAGGVRLLSDVTNPLLGADGAAAVFAPQKGADPGQVEQLDRALGVWAEVLGGDPDLPGAGAAGGAGFGFSAAWGAELVPGSAEIARLSGLDAAAARADVLITGEGRFDATSLGGKVVGHALGLATGSTRVVVIAGRVDAEPVLPDGRVAASVDLTALAGSARAALGEPLRWLREAGARAARGY